MKKWELMNLYGIPDGKKIGISSMEEDVLLGDFKRMAVVGDAGYGAQLALDYMVATLLQQGDVVNIVEFQKPYRYSSATCSGRYMNTLPTEKLPGTTVFVRTPINEVFNEKLEPIMGDKSLIFFAYSGKNPCFDRMRDSFDIVAFITPEQAAMQYAGINIQRTFLTAKNGVIGIIKQGKNKAKHVAFYTFGPFSEAYDTFGSFLRSQQHITSGGTLNV